MACILAPCVAVVIRRVAFPPTDEDHGRPKSMDRRFHRSEIVVVPATIGSWLVFLGAGVVVLGLFTGPVEFASSRHGSESRLTLGRFSHLPWVLRAEERRLVLPVQGMNPDVLRDSWNHRRSGGRKHNAIDIMAPRSTPVIAVEKGTIAKLFRSRAGGLTIYQYDASKSRIYYYAHLERYAPGLAAGDSVEAGQVIGFVGTSGNAPPGSPHLHFAIHELGDDKSWWRGTPLNPYPELIEASRSR